MLDYYSKYVKYKKKYILYKTKLIGGGDNNHVLSLEDKTKYLSDLGIDKSDIRSAIDKIDKIKKEMKVESDLDLYNCIERCDFLKNKIDATLWLGGLGSPKERTCVFRAFEIIVENVKNKTIHIFPFAEFSKECYSSLDKYDNVRTYPVDKTIHFEDVNVDEFDKTDFVNAYNKGEIMRNDKFIKMIYKMILIPLANFKQQFDIINRLINNKDNIILFHCVKCASRSRLALAVYCVLYLNMDKSVLFEIDKIHKTSSFTNNFMRNSLFNFIADSKDHILDLFKNKIFDLYNDKELVNNIILLFATWLKFNNIRVI